MKYQVRRISAKAGDHLQVGEFGFEELKALHRAGVVKDADMFAIEGSTEWAFVGSLFAPNVADKAGKSTDASLETRGRDAARGTKIFGTILACVGTLLLAFEPGIGCMTLSVGLLVFICGRFQE